MKRLLPLICYLISISGLYAQTTCDTITIYANESTNAVCIDTSGAARYVYTNNVPDHSDNYNQPFFTLTAFDFEYLMCAYPDTADSFTPLYEEVETEVGCEDTYTFGVSTNGVKYDPNSAVTFVNTSTGENNIEWHLEATSTENDIGQNMGTLNGGHLNPSGEYHYHAVPTDYFVNDLGIDGTEHSPIVGYAADGFPIYYKYVYTDAEDTSSSIINVSSGYALKSGSRPGDSVSAPGGTYDGLYYEDYEYSTTTLDECNGRYAVTPDYPRGTYYYVITDNYPYIPRCFKGSILDPTFRVGPDASCPESTAATSCAEPVYGCLDPFANNYDPSADFDGGTCTYGAPGNVTDDIGIWLKATDGVLNSSSDASDGESVSTWEDWSGALNDDPTEIAAPTYRNNSSDNINYNPVVDFDGTDDGLDIGEDSIYSTGTGDENGMTWFAIVQPDVAANTKTNQYIFDHGNFASAGFGFAYGYSHMRNYTPTDHGGVNAGAVSHANETNTTLTSYYIDFSNAQETYLNGTDTTFDSEAITLTALTSSEIDEGQNHLATSGPFTIGRQSKAGGLSNNDGRYLDGSIAELIGYKRLLTTTEIQKVESYLAIKYGITLGTGGGGTNGDYLSSSGTTLWDASSSSTYHNDVIAIGRDDDQGLNQKQSHTSDDTTRVYLSTLTSDNSSNGGSFSSDTQFLIVGHQGGEVNANATANAELDAGLYSRLEREWQVTNTSFDGTFNVDITLGDAGTSSITDSDLRLLVDTDGDFSDATAYSAGGGLTISNSGGVITISGISTTHIPSGATRYITLASAFSSTPLSAVTTWSGSSWSSGTPSASSEAVIDSDYNTNTNGAITANSLTVNSGSELTISGGNSVSLSGNLANSGTIIIEEGNSLSQSASSPSNSGTGTYTVQRFAPNFIQQFNYWSSPVQSTTIDDIFGGGSNFYDFNTSTNSWTASTTSATLTPGVGFIGTGTDGTSTTITREFSDNTGFNSGDISFTLTYNSDADNDNDWNLVGNPYPSGLDAVSFLNTNYNGGSGAIENAIYLWNSDGSDLSSSDTDYAIMSTAGVTNAGGNTAPSSATVASCQGFFVQAVSAGSITFSNSHRTTTNNTFLRTQENEWERVWIKAKVNELFSNEILIGFMPDAAEGKGQYDAQKLVGSDHLALYSWLEDKKMAIQGLPTFADDKTVNLGLEVMTAGDYQFELSHLDNFSEDINIYLYDQVTNELTDLRTNAYQVSLVEGNYNDRFSMRFISNRVTALENEQLADEIIITSSTNSVDIEFKDAAMSEAKIAILDLTGKTLISFDNSEENTKLAIPITKAGVYIIKLENKYGFFARKVIIK